MTAKLTYSRAPPRSLSGPESFVHPQHLVGRLRSALLTQKAISTFTPTGARLRCLHLARRFLRVRVRRGVTLQRVAFYFPERCVTDHTSQ
jgi:hypothetical protein